MQPVIAYILMATAAAQPIERVDVIPISTASPTTKQFLTGDGNAKPALIAGELRLPRAGPEKLSACYWCTAPVGSTRGRTVGCKS